MCLLIEETAAGDETRSLVSRDDGRFHSVFSLRSNGSDVELIELTYITGSDTEPGKQLKLKKNPICIKKKKIIIICLMSPVKKPWLSVQ